MPLNRKLLIVAMLGAALPLGGCDDQQGERAVQKLKEFFNAVKPDTLLLKDLTPGVSTEGQIRNQMGKPETERIFTDGSKRLEYPRGPQGLNTYMVDIDRDGKLQAVTQVLTAASFAKIHAGMSDDEVRRLLGKPGEVAVFPLKPETVWSWKWREGGVNGEGMFNVHFDRYHKVYTTSRSDVLRAIGRKTVIRRRQYTRIGLVLGGGAARGWAHIGAIRALHDAGIRPDVVCGTSIGALVGAVYANGDLDWLEEWVSRLTWQTVVRLLDLRLSGGLLGGRKVIQLFAEKFNDRTIGELNLPFAAVATELDTGRESWLQDGSVVDAVRASIAIPGIFTPVWHDGVWLVDGGLSNPVPVSVARGMRADCVIAVDLNNDILNGRDFGGAAVDTPGPDLGASAPDLEAPPPVSLRRNGKPWPRWLAPADERASSDVRVPPAPSARVPSMLSSIAQSIDIMQVRITRSRLAGEPADILIQPRLGGMGIFDFHRAAPAIDEGRAAVEYMLPAIRARLGID